MHEIDATTTEYKVSQLSTIDLLAPSFTLAVFAYNEAKNIASVFDSIAAATAGKDVAVYILVNGCTDNTVDEIRLHASKIAHLYLVEIAIADKANAWNVYVHDILTAQQLETVQNCFFMDGDVTVAADTFTLLNDALAEKPQAEAAGAMPGCGRDRDAWRQRMAINGMLAGNCYALRSQFVKLVRKLQVRMPIGLIGEDFFVSWLVANNIWRNDFLEYEGRRCVFHSKADFTFKSMSPWRMSDYRIYFMRKWRYTLRGIQHQMLVQLINRQGVAAIPRKVDVLYEVAPLPSRFVRCGLDTAMRTIAVQWVRWKRR